MRAFSARAPWHYGNARAGRQNVWYVALVLAVVTLAAYSNTFTAPFVFDDQPAISANETIRSLWPIGPVLSPPAATSVSGRPLLNLSFALNYAISGEAVWSYHALNLLIHLLAGLTLFGIVRRTFRQPALDDRFGAAATGLAGVVAGWWLLHPLQTESVTYVVQRAESLAGLLYLLTVYAFVRSSAQPEALSGAGVARMDPSGARDGRGTGWLVVSVAACCGGMATKEVMATAPLLVLLYDRTFVAGSFGQAWRRRRWYYLALAATWLLLAALVVSTRGRTGSVGLDSSVTPGAYLVTQAYAVALYLKLAFWPAPLVIDYGPEFVVVLDDVWPQALLMVGLLAATAELLWRRSVLGFAAGWFFGILVPSSSLVPIASQTIAEHRMYLPLAALFSLLVAGLHQWRGRSGLVAGAVLALGLGALTYLRNETYRSDLTLWTDAVAHRRHNVRALQALGMAHSNRQEHAEAIPLLTEALRRDRGLKFVTKPAIIHTQLGQHLVALGRVEEAMPHYQAALKLDPYYAPAHLNVARALMRLERPAIAVRHFREAVRLKLDGTEAPLGLAEAQVALGQLDEAIAQYRAVLALKPQLAEAHAGLGDALWASGRADEAVGHFERALQLKPGYEEPARALEKLRAAVNRSAGETTK